MVSGNYGGKVRPQGFGGTHDGSETGGKSISETPKLSQEDQSITERLSSDRELCRKNVVSIDSTTTASAVTSSFPNPKAHDSSIQVFNVDGLLRLRTALSHMITSYIPPTLEAALHEKLASSESPIDFKPLDVRLAHIANIRAETLASRSLTDYSRKRSTNEDDEAAEAWAEKKQKKEDEEKRRKAGESYQTPHRLCRRLFDVAAHCYPSFKLTLNFLGT